MRLSPQPHVAPLELQHQPQLHITNFSSNSEQFVAITPPTRSTSSVPDRSQSQQQTPLPSKYEDFDITTLYPPNPSYDIAEKPWLPGPQAPYVIFDAKLVDPRNSVIREGTTLHLAGGKVVSVSSTTENDRICEFRHGDVKAVKIDAKGYFVCPGLIDCRSPVGNCRWGTWTDFGKVMYT